jgi:hypothetical protein
MAGTVKLCVPDPPGVADFVGFADFVGVVDFVGIADLVGRADLVATGEALCVAAAEVAGVTEGPDSVESPDGEDGADKAVAEPPAAAVDAAVGEFPPSPAQAVRPVPAITTAMSTAGTRHIRMVFYSSGVTQMLQIVKLVTWVTR